MKMPLMTRRNDHQMVFNDFTNTNPNPVGTTFIFRSIEEWIVNKKPAGKVLLDPKIIHLNSFT